MCKQVTENNCIHIRSKELGTILNGHQDSISLRSRNRDIFVKPPKEADTKGKLWHLEKCVYGLNDASLQWHNRVKNVLEKCGATMSKVDQQYSTGWMEKNWKTYLHAMSMISSGEAQRISNRLLSKRFNRHSRLEKKKARHFNTVGWSCSQMATQFSYITASMEKAWSQSHWKRAEFQKHEVMSAQEKQAYRSKTGQILWTSRQSRPDVVFDACQLASKIKDGRTFDGGKQSYQKN